MIQSKRKTCGDLEAALHREWLETNGLGGFASSTIIGLNTRRYHGRLVAATKPPVARFVLLSKLEETLFIDGKCFDLSANCYPGVVHPQGFRYLKEFRLDPFPVFTYEVEAIEIEKSVFMIHGENSTVIHYHLTKNNHPGSPKNLRLEIRPLVAFREYHGTTHENGAFNPAMRERPGWASVTPYQGLPTLHLAHNAIELRKTGDWYRNFEYDAERERGLDFSEDLFNPFVLCFDLRLRRQASIIASTEEGDAAQAVEYRRAEITRRRKTLVACPVGDSFIQSLAAASDQYLVSRGDEKTVIAGYHWFGDWGRDTMIALPGLTLPTGKYEVARNILCTFAKHVNQGICQTDSLTRAGRRNTTRSTQLSGFSKPLAHTFRTRVIWSSCATNSTPCLLTSSPGTFGVRATESKWMTAACWFPGNRESNSRGWTPRSATGW
jgi:predicted glycogen debranching enzyme